MQCINKISCFTYSVRINCVYVIVHTVLSSEKTEEKEMKENLFSGFGDNVFKKKIFVIELILCSNCIFRSRIEVLFIV